MQLHSSLETGSIASKKTIQFSCRSVLIFPSSYDARIGKWKPGKKNVSELTIKGNETGVVMDSFCSIQMYKRIEREREREEKKLPNGLNRGGKEEERKVELFPVRYQAPQN